jgi:predicted enzyme related to lactoylglutathione lyase
LEHFGFDTDDIEGVMARMESQGVGVLLPITPVASGSRISYIEGPDNVRIELVQPSS